jgi:hypothetical protein
MKVTIDNIVYVPVSDANPTAKDLMRALAATYQTEENLDTDEKLLKEAQYLRVSVGEPGYGNADEDEPTIEEFVAKLLRQSNAK